MNTCSICLDEVHLDYSITLSCEHLFHKDCIEECIDHKMKSIEYGTNKLCCPNCRINITELNDTNLEKKLKELQPKVNPDSGVKKIDPKFFDKSVVDEIPKKRPE